MNARTQTLVLTLLAALGVKLVLTNSYLRYVNPWMKWPTLVTAALLLVLSLRYLFIDEDTNDGHQHDDHEQEADQHQSMAGDRVSRAAWALVLPVMVVFVISPPALGAYVAVRRPVPSVPQPQDNGAIPPLPHKAIVPMKLVEFDTRAKWDVRNSLHDRQVQMEGFVTRDHAGHWYLTRLLTFCCAADAVSWRTRIAGAPAPPVNQWVRIVGVWDDPGTKVPRRGTTVLDAQSVTPIKAPSHPYM